MANRNTLRTFYILIVTQTFSMIGSQMTSFAVAIKVFNDTDQATPLTLVSFLSILPRILSANIAGMLADRWDRRYVMVIADVGQAVTTLLLLITFVTGTFELWQLYVLTAISSVFGVFQGPAFDAAVTMLVPDNHRDRANAIRQLTGPSSGLIGPVLAGLLFAIIGAAGVMLIDLFTFVVAMVVVLLAHIPRPAQTEEGRAASGSMWKEAQAGFRYIGRHRALLALLLNISLVNFLLSGAMTLNTPYVLRLTNSEALLGALSSVTSAGAVIGGVIMGAWGGTRPRVHTIMPGLILIGIGLALYGVSRSAVTLGLSSFFMMLWIPMINASFLSVMQAKTPPDLQGRVFAAELQLSLLMMPLSYLIAGPLTDKVLEPAIGTGAWDLVAPLVGSEPGSGIGLIMLFNGTLLAITSALTYAVPLIRRFEQTMPDYVPAEQVEAARDEVETGAFTAATPFAAD
ncbi:MAG TPA: MFS transporter [Aggregatilinea sp.]|uniref:MFS transporter n=1 Tax=Aggregatilinea sp. TaxID=2806333 RepID=UPI002BAA20FF|nr:MFS transporter [Aggregatilinea sp.]HML24384.1 MFS transporter [Aggregatilinea sp.]